MDKQTQTELEAAAFRRLLIHLQERTDVQNIDLMNLAGFCRNCLSKWYLAAIVFGDLNNKESKVSKIVSVFVLVGVIAWPVVFAALSE